MQIHEIQEEQLSGTRKQSSAAKSHSQMDQNAIGKQAIPKEKGKLRDLFYLDLRKQLTSKSYKRVL